MRHLTKWIQLFHDPTAATTNLRFYRVATQTRKFTAR
jgi:hypothetical protein